MSDGENATPDPHVAPEPRASRPSQGSAPWERVPATPAGNHSEGVAVADLIAKLTGSQQINPVTRRSAEPLDDAAATEPIPVGTRDEIPDLAAIARSRGPLAADRNPAPPAPPSRPRTTAAAGEPDRTPGGGPR